MGIKNEDKHHTTGISAAARQHVDDHREKHQHLSVTIVTPKHLERTVKDGER